MPQNIDFYAFNWIKEIYLQTIDTRNSFYLSVLKFLNSYCVIDGNLINELRGSVLRKRFMSGNTILIRLFRILGCRSAGI